VTESVLEARAARPVRPRFFLWMAAVMAAMVFYGFSLSYFLPMARGALAPLAPVVHVHGSLYFAWMALLVAQSVLVAQGRIALHRSLGLTGIALATGLIIFGAIITALFARVQIADPAVYGLTYISLVALVAFGALFVLAMTHLREPEAHRRYVLLATIAFLIASLNRIYAYHFGLDFETYLSYLPRYLTVDLLIVALLIYDLRTRGRIHRATLVGTAVNLVPQILHAPIVGSSTFVALTHGLASLAHYP
jgi:hypothetical protein